MGEQGWYQLEVSEMPESRAMPEIVAALCTLCGQCVDACPEGALRLTPDRQLVIDQDTCQYCGDCEGICPYGAIRLPYDIVLAGKERLC